MKKFSLNIQLFASGTINGSSTSTNADCQITWSSTSNGSEANSSSLTVKIQIKKSGSGSTTGTFSGTLKINGTSYSVSKKFSPYNWGSWATVATKTVTIAHEANGQKTVAINGSLTQTGTTMAGTYTASGNATLDTIPRGSTFNTTSWDRDTQRALNSTLSFPATQQVTPAYHKLEARFLKSDGNEQTIATRTGVAITSNSINFTFSSAELSTIYNLMASETTHFIRMYLMTYTDSGYTTQLGETSALWWTGKIPDNIIPSVAIGTPTEAGTTPSTWGVFVKGKSKLRYTLTGTGTYGSQIQSYKSTANGYTYTTSNVTTEFLTQVGTNTITAEVKDSRQRTGTASRTLTVYDYTNPTITTAEIQRCDTNGNIDDQGQYAYIKFKGSVSSCNSKNKGTFKIAYKLKTASSYTEVTIASNTESIDNSGVLTSGGNKVQFDANQAYDIRFTITDAFTTTTQNKELTTGFDLFNFNPSGNSMAIGKVSTRSTNEKALDIGINTDIQARLKASTFQNMKISAGTGTTSTGLYIKLCKIKCDSHKQGRFAYFKIFIGSGNNGRVDQNAYIDLSLQQGWTGTNDGRFGASWTLHPMGTGFNNTNTNIKITSNNNLEYDLWFYTTHTYCLPNYTYECDDGITIIHASNETSTTAPTGTSADCLIKYYPEKYTQTLEAFDGRITDANITHYYDNSRAHAKLLLATSSMTANKPAYDGFILACDWDNAGAYNGQFFMPVIRTKPLQYRVCDNGTWETWEDIYKTKSLYDNATGQGTGTLTLDETCVNFSYIEVFYKPNDNVMTNYRGGYGSVKVYSPNGKKIQMQLQYDNGTYWYSCFSAWTFNGTSLTKNSEIRWRSGTGTAAQTRTDTTTNDSNIYIVKIIGYR